MTQSQSASAPAVFDFQSHEVRTFIRDDKPWFVAADVCAVLSIKNHRTSIALLDDDEKGVHTMDTPSSNQHGYSGTQKTEISIISESGLYALVLRSRKPEARKFAKWVTSEVLPAIRKTGSYIHAPLSSACIAPEQAGELATLLAERFEGAERAYAWSRFNNHFRIARYRELPATRYAEACAYLRALPKRLPAPGLSALPPPRWAEAPRKTPEEQIESWLKPNGHLFETEFLFRLMQCCLERTQRRYEYQKDRAEGKPTLVTWGIPMPSVMPQQETGNNGQRRHPNA
jgi:prophage antirepressor-like protein